MALLGFYLPLAVSVIIAVVAHSLITRYWYACRRSGFIFALIMFAWVIALRQISGLGFLTVVEIGRFLLFTLGYFVAGFVIATLVGVPFYLDRLIQQREKERSNSP